MQAKRVSQNAPIIAHNDSAVCNLGVIKPIYSKVYMEIIKINIKLCSILLM